MVLRANPIAVSGEVIVSDIRIRGLWIGAGPALLDEDPIAETSVCHFS
jgi:hypothetical protein